MYYEDISINIIKCIVIFSSIIENIIYRNKRTAINQAAEKPVALFP